jgi:ATP-dependent DNA helicase RecG
MVTVTLPVIDAFEGSEEEAQVLKALSVGRIMSRGEIEQQTGLSRARALTALESLIGRNVVVKRGTGRSTKYERA